MGGATVYGSDPADFMKLGLFVFQEAFRYTRSSGISPGAYWMQDKCTCILLHAYNSGVEAPALGRYGTFYPPYPGTQDMNPHHLSKLKLP